MLSQFTRGLSDKHSVMKSLAIQDSLIIVVTSYSTSYAIYYCMVSTVLPMRASLSEVLLLVLSTHYTLLYTVVGLNVKPGVCAVSHYISNLGSYY